MSSPEYFDTISENYKARWTRKVNQVSFTKEQHQFLQQNHVPINIVVFSAEWCPDCQNAVPIVMKMEELASSFLTVYIIDRDDHLEQLEDYKTNGGARIPVVIFMNKEFQELNRWVERSILAYELVYKAKKKAIEKNLSNYRTYQRELFKDNSKRMFQMNCEELFYVFRKSVMIVNSGINLTESLKH